MFTDLDPVIRTVPGRGWELHEDVLERKGGKEAGKEGGRGEEGREEEGKGGKTKEILQPSGSQQETEPTTDDPNEKAPNRGEGVRRRNQEWSGHSDRSSSRKVLEPLDWGDKARRMEVTCAGGDTS